MLVYIFYLLAAGIIATIFKLVVGLVMGLPAAGVIALTKMKFETHPRLFTIIGVINHTIAATLYALVIFIFTYNFAYSYGGNAWFYMIASVLWGTTVVAGSGIFYKTMLAICTLGLIAAWYGYSIFGILQAGAIVGIVSLIYNVGKMNMLVDIAKDEEQSL